MDYEAITRFCNSVASNGLRRRATAENANEPNWIYDIPFCQE
jgi:hypothetical protein